MSAGADWRAAIRLDALPEGKLLAARFDERVLALCRIGSDVLAFDDQCPHRGAPFSELGYVAGGRLTCGWHYWQFELATGQHCQIPGVRVARWRTRVVDGAVEVDLSGPEP